MRIITLGSAVLTAGRAISGGQEQPCSTGFPRGSTGFPMGSTGFPMATRAITSISCKGTLFVYLEENLTTGKGRRRDHGGSHLSQTITHAAQFQLYSWAMAGSAPPSGNALTIAKRRQKKLLADKKRLLLAALRHSAAY